MICVSYYVLLYMYGTFVCVQALISVRVPLETLPTKEKVNSNINNDDDNNNNNNNNSNNNSKALKGC